MRLGLISDTHGVIAPELYAVFNGVDLICHAGDIGGEWGDPEGPLVELKSIAPVQAVSGNVDGFELSGYPRWVELETPQGRLGITHRAIEAGRLVPGLEREIAKRQLKILVYGHTHEPAFFENNGALWINPGSAGKKTHRCPQTAALLVLEAPPAAPEIHFFELENGREILL